MGGSPWICPRCGAAANTDACPNCLHERPMTSGSVNRPGSYFRIVQGPQGYAGMPKAFGIAMLMVILGWLAAMIRH